MTMPNETHQDPQRAFTAGEPKDLKRQADANRENLEVTLNEIERKLSPGDLLDRSLEYVQANGGDMLQKIGATMSKNPLPLIVTSAGLLWLFASSRSSAPRDHVESEFDRSADEFDSARPVSGSTQNKVRAVKQKARRTLDAAESRATNAMHATRERAHEYGDTLQSFVREQPLACGAIAVAAGAVLAAAFPVTPYERELVSRARGAAGKVLEAANSDESDDDESAIDSQPRH